MDVNKGRLLLSASSVAMSLALIAACGGAEGEAGEEGTANETTLQIGTQAGAELVYGAYYVADTNGYFEDEGLTNEFQSFDSGPLALTAMASGELDGAMSAWLPHVQAFAQGTDMQVVASLAKGNTTLVGGPGITSIEQLDGAKVGSPGIGTIHDAALTVLADEYGIEVEHVPNKITTLPLMLRKGEIDAFIGWETVASQAVLEIEGANYLERDPVPGNENLELALSGEMIQDRPEVAQKVVNAVYRGAKYAEACPEEFLTKIADRMNVPNAQELVEAAAPSVDVTQPELDSETAEMWYGVAVGEGKVDVSDWEDYAAFESDIWASEFLEKAEQEYSDWNPTC